MLSKILVLLGIELQVFTLWYTARKIVAAVCFSYMHRVIHLNLVSLAPPSPTVSLYKLPVQNIIAFEFFQILIL